MDLQKLLTVENLLKVLLAIAIGVMLYKVFFGKETYDNYPDLSGYKYPMDYEEDEEIDLVDAVSAPGDEDDMDLVSADSEEDDVDQIEEIEDVVDAEDDIIYEDDDVVEEDFVVENQKDVDEVKNFDLMYASDVEDGLQENFVLYSNLVGVDTNYA